MSGRVIERKHCKRCNSKFMELKREILIWEFTLGRREKIEIKTVETFYIKKNKVFFF